MEAAALPVKLKEKIQLSQDPKVKNGWLDHVLKAEYLFLENIYSEDQMKKMKIEKLELFKKKIKKIFDNLDDFCESIEQEYKDNPDIEIVFKEITELNN